MKEYKAILTYADYYDATTATRRVLLASELLYSEIKIAYWGRLGFARDSKDPIYKGIDKDVFIKSAPPRSFQVLMLFIKFQFWIFKSVKKYKPDLIHAFYLYTIIPCLIYKFLFNKKCKVIYDPRDYVAACYQVPKIVSWTIKWVDSLCAKLADFTIFPDKQYFTYYGKLSLKENKFLIIPNSLDDSYEKVKDEDIHAKYNISRDKLLIPVIGYFSETRGKALFFEIIRQQPEGFQFIFAGDFRDQADIDFLNSHSNVTFLGNISYLEALALMKDAAIVPLLYDPALLNNKYAYPTKFYDSLMMGTPVLVSYGQGDVYDDVMKYNLGLGIKYNDIEGFKEVLEAIKTGAFQTDKAMLRKHYLTKYDFNIFRNKLRQIYLGLKSESF